MLCKEEYLLPLNRLAILLLLQSSNAKAYCWLTIHSEQQVLFTILILYHCTGLVVGGGLGGTAGGWQH